MKFKAVLLVFFAALSVFAQKGEGNEGATGPQSSFPNFVEGSFAGGGVLFDSTGNAGGNGVPDQNFEAAFDAYDCMGADDFEVPPGMIWDIDTVFIVGTLSGAGVPASANVTFHADAGGLPGAVVATYSSVAIANNNAGQLTVNLPATASIPEGRHWMAFQVNMDFGGGNGQHFWSNTNTQFGNLAAWINPGDGFGSGCINWTDTQTCGVGGGATVDLQMTLSGVERSALMVPTMSEVGLAIFLILLAGTAVFFLRKQRMSAA